MTKEEEIFTSIGQQLKIAVQSQMFGKPCFKVSGKAFICYFQQSMVFKLNGDMHRQALALPGSLLFDPSGNNRPMKEWVQLPFEYAERWAVFAEASMKYVMGA